MHADQQIAGRQFCQVSLDDLLDEAAILLNDLKCLECAHLATSQCQNLAWFKRSQALSNSPSTLPAAARPTRSDRLLRCT